MTATSGLFFRPSGQAASANQGLTTGVAGFMDTLRAVARETREQRKIKLVYIAAASDRGESALSRWENGLTDAPGHLDRVIDAYAHAFDMTPTELVEAVALRMREDDAAQAMDDLAAQVQREKSPAPQIGRAKRKSTAGRKPAPTRRR